MEEIETMNRVQIMRCVLTLDRAGCSSCVNKVIVGCTCVNRNAVMRRCKQLNWPALWNYIYSGIHRYTASFSLAARRNTIGHGERQWVAGRPVGTAAKGEEVMGQYSSVQVFKTQVCKYFFVCLRLSLVHVYTSFDQGTSGGVMVSILD